MKIIDLLNKIANGEGVPKKIKYNNTDYYLYDNYSYLTFAKTRFFDSIYFKELNDEVEIIEEDKGISKDIKWYLIEEQEKEETKIAQINMNFRIMREKMAEIIDKINEEK
jgi:hypothetical protein